MCHHPRRGRPRVGRIETAVPEWGRNALGWNEIKTRAFAFSKEWRDEASEDAEAKSGHAVMADIIRIAGLFVATAVAEIVGCWLVLLWRKEAASAWLLLPAALSLALFAWLLTLHPVASGRIYAAYGGIYVATALVWLVAVDRVALNRVDVLGGGLILLGALVMVAGHWSRA